MPRGKPGLLELLEPTALPAPPKEADNGPIPDTTDAPNLPQFGLDSLSPRLVITPEKEVPDSGIITLQINQQFTSLTPTTLTIDSSDETNIKFSAAGGGGGINVGNLFGAAHALMVRGGGSNTAPGYFTGGTQERAHPYLTYNSTTGEITVNRTGAYMMYFSGYMPTAGAGSSNSILVTFTTSTSTLPTGYPPNLINRVNYDSAALSDSNVYVNESAIVFASTGTVLRPSFFAGWSGTWGNRTLIVTSLYGPGSLAETQWELTKTYAYQYPTFHPDGSGVYQWVGFDGAPYGNNGSVTAHPLNTVEAYIGDAANPLWYPDGPMYMSFNISPFPDLIDGSISITVASFEGNTPNDLEYGVNKYNVGNGVAEQGFWLRMPHKMGSYSGTSFKILFTAEGIVANHPIFFKQCADGQNGCTTTGIQSLYFQAYSSQSDGITPQNSLFQNPSWYWWENGEQISTRLVTTTQDQLQAAIHFTVQQGTLWDDPNNLTTNVTFIGLVQKGIGNSYNIIDTSGGAIEPTSPPIVDYIDESQTDTTDWSITPVGHWRLRYALNQDYWQIDPQWPGDPYPSEIPAFYYIEWFKGADLVGTAYVAMGSAV